MANNWLIEQIIDLQHGVQAPLVWPNALMLCGDNNAHTWRVTIMDGRESAQITGNITGYFVRTDGNTVTVTGGLTGNVATVTLPQACYATDGDLYAVMRLKSSSGTITLSALILPVRNVLTDSIIDPGEVIPSLDDLLAQIDACEEATDAANEAADTANQAAQSASAVESDIESSEAARVTAEQGRVAAEQARATAEAERVANEDERQQQLTNAINAAEADADRAEAAADAAETLIAMPPLFSDTPPTDEPTLNKLWVDTGVSPTMMRRWRGADVTTEREYTQTRVGCGKNLCNSPVVHGTRSASDGMFYSHAGASTNRTSNAEIIPVTGGETYTLSWSGDDSNPAHLEMFLFYKDTTLLSYTQQSSPTITIPANANGLGFNLLSQNAYTTDYITDVQLEMGSAATAYEPYEDVPFISIDNAQGQVQSVAVEAGYRARQAGTGDPSPENIRAITGRDSVEIAACGKNLLNPPGDKTISGLTYTLQSDGTYLVNGTITGISELDLYEGVLPVGQYTISGGTDGMQVALAVYKSDGTYIRAICTSTYGAPATGTVTALTGDEAYHRAFIQSPDTVGLTLTNIAISPQLERGDTATAFEPYRPMGGGTVTPTEPLYGLPDAMDTVEASADGDVTVTRRTAVVKLDGTESITYANAGASTEVQQFNAYQVAVGGVGDIYAPVVCSHLPYSPNVSGGATLGICLYPSSQHATLSFGMPITSLTQYGYTAAEQDTWVPAFKSYLAAQKTAGTPVTIVYELATPTTETPADVDPIVPEKGQLNIYTDANALSATVHGSGWDTISDQTGLLATIAQLTARVAALEAAAVSTINNTTEG